MQLNQILLMVWLHILNFNYYGFNLMPFSLLQCLPNSNHDSSKGVGSNRNRTVEASTNKQESKVRGIHIYLFSSFLFKFLQLYFPVTPKYCIISILLSKILEKLLSSIFFSAFLFFSVFFCVLLLPQFFNLLLFQYSIFFLMETNILLYILNVCPSSLFFCIQFLDEHLSQ